MARKPSVTETEETASEVTTMQETASEVTTIQETARRVPARQGTGEALTLGTGMSLKVKRFVNLPVISLRKVGTEVVVRVLDAIHDGADLKDENSRRGPRRQPVRMMTCQAMDGTQGQLIVGFLIEEELTEKFPKDSYVGEWFYIKRTDTKTKNNGDEYGLYTIVNVEPPGPRIIDQAAD